MANLGISDISWEFIENYPKIRIFSLLSNNFRLKHCVYVGVV